MRRCCGVRSSQKKIELETSAERLSEAGMHAEAAEVLLQRARLSPKNPLIWNDLGVEYVAAGQTQEAHEAFRQALKALADYTFSSYNLGRLALQRCAAEQAKEDPSEELVRRIAGEAIEHLQESLSKDLHDPLRYHTHVALSAAYVVVGDSIQAKIHMDKASELKPAERAECKGSWMESLLLRAIAKPESKSPLPYVFSTGKELWVSKPEKT